MFLLLGAFICVTSRPVAFLGLLHTLCPEYLLLLGKALRQRKALLIASSPPLGNVVLLVAVHQRFNQMFTMWMFLGYQWWVHHVSLASTMLDIRLRHDLGCVPLRAEVAVGGVYATQLSLQHTKRCGNAVQIRGEAWNC